MYMYTYIYIYIYPYIYVLESTPYQNATAPEYQKVDEQCDFSLDQLRKAFS